MSLHKTCKEATLLMLQKQDKPLGLIDSLGLKFHLFICKACPNFERQLQTMKQALSDWRNEIGKETAK
jgi:hypothetical protein